LSATATFVSAQQEAAGQQWVRKELYFFTTERRCWPTMGKEGALLLYHRKKLLAYNGA